MIMEINKVLAVVKRAKDHINTIKEIKEFFHKKKIRLELFDFAEEPIKEKSFLKNVDLAISLGGDGTLLYCSQFLAGKNIPILAVNLGNFGFITDVSKTEWQEVYNKYIHGEIGISTRIMLDVHVKRQGNTVASFSGLNDGVIIASGISKIVNLKAYLSNTHIGRYRADGIIIATPTGSTAYSMSAGGPILHPEMEAFILCPICPFSLSHRPLVVPGSELVEIEVVGNQRTGLILTVDGQASFDLKENDRVIFKKSNHFAHIIRSNKRNFYEVLRDKFKWSGEPYA